LRHQFAASVCGISLRHQFAASVCGISLRHQFAASVCGISLRHQFAASSGRMQRRTCSLAYRSRDLRHRGSLGKSRRSYARHRMTDSRMSRAGDLKLVSGLPIPNGPRRPVASSSSAVCRYPMGPKAGGPQARQQMAHDGRLLSEGAFVAMAANRPPCGHLFFVEGASLPAGGIHLDRLPRARFSSISSRVYPLVSGMTFQIQKTPTNPTSP
jgi:hypothetical protein